VKTADTDIRRFVEGVWKVESPRVIAGLVRLTHDVSLAEDLAQDALLTALETWPRQGVPDNPGAWLMTTAKRRAVDRWRHEKLAAEKHQSLAHEQDETLMPDIERVLETDVGDDLLRLMLIACHPVLPPESRIALTLKLLGGLSTGEIARAFLVPEPTIAQRIVRAKRKLAEADVAFEFPDENALPERIDSVLDVLYLIFNEGYTATRGEDWLRPALCDEAIRLARMLAELVPDESEPQALCALMQLQASRNRARVNEHGEPVLLDRQNRALWDQLLIRRGLNALERARRAAIEPGPYLLQAEIAACHARAQRAEDTDWRRIVMLYTLLAQMTRSPVVELNRAVAVSMAHGPEAALPLVVALNERAELASYHLLPSVHGDLLFRLGRHEEAAEQFTRAAGMTENAHERAFLERRAAACRKRESS